MAEPDASEGSRRDSIADAAFALFAERGYADTRVDDVAARAGVAKGTVYLYFDSKEALFRAVVERQLAPGLSALAALRHVRDVDPQGLLRQLYGRMATLVDSGAPSALLRLVIGESSRFPELADIYFRTVVEQGLSTLQDLLRQAVRQGRLRDASVIDYPMAFAAPLVTAALWRLVFQDKRSLDTAGFLDAFAEMALAGLQPEASQ